MNWSPVDDPLGNPILSTIVAVLPIVVLPGGLAFFRIKAAGRRFLARTLLWPTPPSFCGHEGGILRHVFFHSLALAALMGRLIMAQAYVYPFTAPVLH